MKRPSTRGDAASHVEVLLYDQATLLNTDGSSRTMHTEVMRSMSQKGRDEIVRIGLPTDGQVRVLKAFAQTPDGQRQEASSIDKTSVRFRNLEVGSTVVLQYAHYPRRGGALSDDFYSEGSFSLAGRHIDRMRWVIVAPKGKELHLDVDARVKHATSEVTAPQGTASMVHELTREDVQALPSEPSMVPFPDVQAHVVVTTLPSWDSFIRWERAILDESFPADPGLDALATRLTQGATTPRDKLGKLFAFVAQEIRYQQEYESILAGWQPHRSSVVLERKYGDCKDKATLLIALARAVGIDLEFAVLATHRLGHPDRKVVFPKFNHAIVYVPAQRGIEEQRAEVGIHQRPGHAEIRREVDALIREQEERLRVPGRDENARQDVRAGRESRRERETVPGRSPIGAARERDRIAQITAWKRKTRRALVARRVKSRGVRGVDRKREHAPVQHRRERRP